MFAAPKMPNLIASPRLAGLGGMKADMTRPMSAAISSVYTAYQYRWFARGAFGCLESVQAGTKCCGWSGMRGMSEMGGGC